MHGQQNIKKKKKKKTEINTREIDWVKLLYRKRKVISKAKCKCHMFTPLNTPTSLTQGAVSIYLSATVYSWLPGTAGQLEALI